MAFIDCYGYICKRVHGSKLGEKVRGCSDVRFLNVIAAGHGGTWEIHILSAEPLSVKPLYNMRQLVYKLFETLDINTF